MKAQEIQNIIQNISTPAYVFDLDALRQRVGTIQKMLKRENIGLCYAMKANPFLVGALSDLADRFEVCSPGEFRICEREQLPMDKLVISGVNKERQDILRIVTSYQGQGNFTVESLEQLNLFAECAKETEKELKILVRISSGNQFGVDFEQVKGILETGKEGGYPKLRFQGIQYYSGTQKKLKKVQKELQKLEAWIQELEDLGIEVPELEYGPGFYVPYFQSEPEEDMEGMMQEFCAYLSEIKFSGRVILELGRFLTADCGSFFTTLVDHKETDGQIYGIVDGGIHHLNYYGQVMAMKLPYVQHISLGKKISQNAKEWTICGSLCTTADVIVRQLPLVGAQIGDVLVFERTGAYSMMEGMNLFLSRDLPQVLFWSKEHGIEVVRKAQGTDRFNSCMP